MCKKIVNIKLAYYKTTQKNKKKFWKMYTQNYSFQLMHYYITYDILSLSIL